MDFDRY